MYGMDGCMDGYLYGCLLIAFVLLCDCYCVLCLFVFNKFESVLLVLYTLATDFTQLTKLITYNNKKNA